MSWATPHSWTAGDDALSAYLQSMTDAILQLQGLAPSTGQRLDYFVGNLAASQSIPNTMSLVPLLLLEEVDDANGHSDSTNPSRYVPKNAGRLILIGTGAFASDASGLRNFQWLKNGTGIGPSSQLPTVTSGSQGYGATVVTEVSVNGTTDYLELAARQNSANGSVSVTLARAVIMSSHA